MNIFVKSVVLDDATASQLVKLRQIVRYVENGLVLGVIISGLLCFINVAYYVSWKLKKARKSLILHF